MVWNADIYPFGRTLECECGKTHRITPDAVIYSSDAFEELPARAAHLCNVGRTAVIFDARTAIAAGNDAAEKLRLHKWDVCEVLVPDSEEGISPACDLPAFKCVRESCAGSGLVVAVGSGVISDLGKWAAFDLGIPLICFATAASMNGYASANVAAAVNGVKTVVRAKPPDVILSLPDVLCRAPLAMTLSGLGDVLAKSVSSADWALNRYLFGDYYCERSNSLIADIEPMFMSNPEAIGDCRPEAVENLFGALLLTGAAMTMAESSAPASGGEHLISHAIDMMSLIDGVPHAMHGSQVGIGTILTSELYRRIIETENPAAGIPGASIDMSFWRGLSVEVGSHYSDKISRIEKASGILSSKGGWDVMRETVASFIRPPRRIRDCLKRAGAPHTAADIGCDKGRMYSAFVHAHEIRSRFTVLDIARIAGIMPGKAGEIMEEWV